MFFASNIFTSTLVVRDLHHRLWTSLRLSCRKFFRCRTRVCSCLLLLLLSTLTHAVSAPLCTMCSRKILSIAPALTTNSLRCPQRHSLSQLTRPPTYVLSMDLSQAPVLLTVSVEEQDFLCLRAVSYLTDFYRPHVFLSRFSSWFCFLCFGLTLGTYFVPLTVHHNMHFSHLIVPK